MAKPRLIPVILLKNGLIVRSSLFRHHQIIGNPINTIARLSNWNVDELVLLDIGTEDHHDMRRDDHAIRYRGTGVIDLLRQIADVCFMPLSFGGRIRSLEDIQLRLEAGADKCVINSQAIASPAFITEAARRFGSQCIVVSIDVLRHPDGRLEVYSEGGKRATGLDPVAWAKEAEARGAGEIFLNSIDRDGAGNGYDIEAIRQVGDATTIPLIACGGVGNYDHFPAAILEGGAAAAAAANIFHFFELSYPIAKQTCREKGINMRPVGLGSQWFPRDPVYDLEERRSRLEERLARARAGAGPARVPAEAPRIRYCTRCVYPSTAATPMSFDEEGVCMGCRTAETKVEIPATEWKRREGLLAEMLEQGRSRDGTRHDCVIAVSGGKDSYFQTHLIKNVLGFNPLLVTYYGNNFTEEGHYNLYRMKEAFGVDHVIYSPSVTLLKKLNRLGFTVMGDMNWHNHVGIFTVPMREAAVRGIPLVFYGEHGWLDLSGQFSMNDFVDHTYRMRLEHYARGYDWSYMVGLEGIAKGDMVAYQYPTDEDIFRIGLRGVHLGNYVYWEANEHTKLVMKEYGWKPSERAFDRTYRTMSNLDDMHENGVHDYLKYIKFGYGRCTDHAVKDIRAGQLSRGQAVDLVRKYDHVKPSDLARWLDYVGMTEQEFDSICDTFRDPRVWYKRDGKWKKDDLWGSRD